MKWMMIVFVIGQAGDGLDSLSQVGPFNVEALCEIAAKEVQDTAQVHARRTVVARCVQSEDIER